MAARSETENLHPKEVGKGVKNVGLVVGLLGLVAMLSGLPVGAGIFEFGVVGTAAGAVVEEAS